MTRDWKPGDVAMVQKNDGEWHPAIRNSDNDEWICYHGIACGPNKARPLVAIDPEDREQVEQLASTYFTEWEKSSDCGRVVLPHETMPLPSHYDAMQAALRSLIAPPKCPAALNIKGEHFGCDQPPSHGMAHGNKAAGAIWGESE